MDASCLRAGDGGANYRLCTQSKRTADRFAPGAARASCTQYTAPRSG